MKKKIWIVTIITFHAIIIHHIIDNVKRLPKKKYKKIQKIWGSCILATPGYTSYQCVAKCVARFYQSHKGFFDFSYLGYTCYTYTTYM